MPYKPLYDPLLVHAASFLHGEQAQYSIESDMLGDEEDWWSGRLEYENPRPDGPYRAVTARFCTWCWSCGLENEPGQKIVKHGPGWIHEGCYLEIPLADETGDTANES